MAVQSVKGGESAHNFLFPVKTTKTKVTGSVRVVQSALLVLFLILFAGRVEECLAKTNELQQFVEDRQMPTVGPEEVVTSFIELADLGKGANRDNDERYPHFCALTELRIVPDDSQRLIIDSYSIVGKTPLKSGDVIVMLKMDVRAIHIESCEDKDNYFKNERNNCNWRDRTAHIYNINRKSGNRVSLAYTDQFLHYVFDGDDIKSELLAKKPGIYAVPKNTREWIFEIRLVTKRGKWLIAMDSIPIEVSYIDSEIENYEKMVKAGHETKKICEGKMVPNNSFDTKRCKTSLSILMDNIKNLQILKFARGDQK